MDTEKNTARIIAALFITTMLAGMMDACGIAPSLHAPLADIYPNELLVRTGAFLILFMSIGVVGIAAMLFPILKRHNEAIAIAYACFRSIECLLLMLGAITSLLLIALSREYLTAGAPADSHYQSLAAMAMNVRYLGYQVAMLTLGLGSLFVCYVFFQSRLIPRWISVVGFIGYAMLLASAVLDMLGVIDTRQDGALLYAPGALFELILLPAWLIAKGFASTESPAPRYLH